jgi:uncharacterized membrane protein
MAFAKLGDPTYWLKAPSVIAGTLTVPVTYMIGARTVGRGAGLVAGGLLALSPYAVFYGSEARAYALTALCVTLSTLFLLLALERRRWPWWVAFAAALAASMYSHYVAAFPLAAEVAWALWYHRDRWRPLLLACAGAAVAYLPWIPGLLDDRSSPYQDAINRVWPFTLEYIPTALGQWAAGVPTWRVIKVPGPGALALLVAGVVLLAAGLLVVRRRLHPSPRVVLLIALVAAGPVLAALWSLLEPSVFVPRTFVASLPALALLVGAAVMVAPRAAAVTAAVCLFAGLGIGTARTFGDFTRPPFRAAANQLNHQAAPGQPVLGTGFFDPGALEAHLHPARPVFRIDCSNASSGPGQVLLAQVHCGRVGSGLAPAAALGRRTGRLWQVSWGRGPRPVPGFRVVASHRYDGGLGVWVSEEVPSGARA